MDLTLTYDALTQAFESLKVYFLIYCLCVVLIFLLGKSLDRERFVYPVIFLVLTLYNPILVSPIAETIGLLPRIRRIYWLLPVTLLIVYLIVRVVSEAGSAVFKVAVILAALLIAGSWNNYFENRKTPENIYKISDESILVSEKLHELSPQDGDIMVVFSDDRLQEIRMYDASVRNILRRKDLLNWQPDVEDEEYVREVYASGKTNRIITLFVKYGCVPEDITILSDALEKKDPDYLICDKDSMKMMTLEDMGARKVSETDSFAIYEI